MNWSWVEPLESEELISEFETKENYHFPDDFILTIKKYNAGYPELQEFVSWQGKRKKKRVFSSLISLNKDSKVNMWLTNRIVHTVWSDNGEFDNYVVFADDPFGNKLCFDKTNDHIVFIDHETMKIEPIADSFSDFIASLKKIK